MKRRIARHFIVPVLGGALLCALTGDRAAALENSVVVQSASVPGGIQDLPLAVYVNNSDPLAGLTIPLEIRSLDSGAFITGGTRFKVNLAGRMSNSPFTQEGCPFDPVFERPFPHPASVNVCSGPTSSSYDSPSGIDPSSMSPDAHLMEIGAGCGPLAPGADPASEDSASFLLIFDVGTTAGRFVIDTACVIGRHLDFTLWNSTIVLPSFSHGEITVLPPCGCPCQADPECDSSTNIMDVVLVIDRAFRSGDAMVDSTCTGTSPTDGLTDVDCSGSTDIVDVVKVVDVGLRGGNPRASFCGPCGADFTMTLRRRLQTSSNPVHGPL